MQHYIIPMFDPQRFIMEDYSEGGIAVIFKDLLYDPKRETALIYVIVNEDHLMQNLRIVISKVDKGWQINLAQGSLFMPTVGVAKAIERVYQAALMPG